MVVAPRHVGWSTGQPCLRGFNPSSWTLGANKPFALLTPGVRRILNQSRVSSSARAVVMMSKMGTRRMAAVLGGSPRSWVGLAEGSGSSALKCCHCETRELLVERGCVRLVAALRVFAAKPVL